MIRARPDESPRAKLEQEVRTLEEERADMPIAYGTEAWRIRDRLSEARERLRALGDFCNCVGCEDGCVCRVEVTKPREWPPEPIEEFAARHQERVEGERWNGINDEVTHDGE